MTTNEDGDECFSCECDNGHEQAGTVCRYCWGRGWRTWSDRWPTDKDRLLAALDYLSRELRSDGMDEAFERIDMLQAFVRMRAS